MSQKYENSWNFSICFVLISTNFKVFHFCLLIKTLPFLLFKTHIAFDFFFQNIFFICSNY